MNGPLEEIFDVAGSVVLVTGAGSGIGRTIAETLAACGATVIGADRDEDRLGEIKATEGIEPIHLDVSDAGAVDNVVDSIIENHGRIDAVFANAGIARGGGLTKPEGTIDAFDMTAWQELMAVNLNGVLHTVRAAARPMKRQRSGSIVMTASTAGLRADPFVSYSYVVAKAGVVNMVRQAALDLARWQIRVNAIAPGPFKTNIGGGGPIDPAAEARWGSSVALGRMGDTRELRGLALLLASNASSFMTGCVYPVDGGALLQSLGLDQAP